VVANYLPPPLGSGAGNGTGYNFIMVGADDNDIAKIGAIVEADHVPSGNTVQVRIAYRDPSGAVALLGDMDSYSSQTALLSATVPTNPGGTGNKYFVVAWIDNGSGDYNSASVKDSTEGKWTIYLVSTTIRDVDINELSLLAEAAPPYTSAFLTAFLKDNAIDGADSVNNIEIKNNDPKLHHNTGLIWINSSPNPYGNAIQNVFNSNNDLTNTLIIYPEFIQLVKNTLDGAKPTVQSFTGWTGPTHTFPILMSAPELLLSGDLGTAFGHIAITATLYAYVQRSGLELLVLNMVGTATKLYSFDVTKPWPAPAGAEVQACYDKIGSAGHIYKILIQLDVNNYTNVLPYNFY
jgi:hypothetical protein